MAKLTKLGLGMALSVSVLFTPVSQAQKSGLEANPQTQYSKLDVGPWAGTVDIGGNYYQGNSDLFNIYGGIEGSRDFDNGNSWILGIEGNYGESNGVKNAEWVRAYSQYNYDLKDPFYAGLFTDFLHDDIADLNYRLTINPLLGYYVFNNDRGFLALEAGPAYVWQQQAGVNDSYFSLRFAERFQYDINDRVRVWQSLEYLPEVSDFGNFLLIGEAGVQTWVGPRLSLKAFVQDRYDSDPEVGLEKNDFGTFLSLSYGDLRPGGPVDGFAKPDDAWFFTGGLGASLQGGNSDTTAISAAIDGTKSWADREAGVGIFGGYSETSDVINAQYYGAYGFYNFDINEKWYAGARLDYLHDQIADIDYRFNIGPHLGYRAIDVPQTRLKLEVGPGYTFESQGGVEDSYLTIRAGEYFDHQLNESVKVFQSFEYFGSLDDSDDYYLLNKVGFDVALSSGWSWSNSLLHTFDNTPATGREDTDIAVTSGLKWAF